MLFYGLATIPFSYLFTRFKTASSGYAILLIISLFSGGILTIIVNALEQSMDDYYTHIGYVLHIIFLMIFPRYGISYVSINYGRKVVQNYNWYTMSSQKRRALCRFHDYPCCLGEFSEHYKIVQIQHFNQHYEKTLNRVIPESRQVYWLCNNSKTHIY